MIDDYDTATTILTSALARKRFPIGEVRTHEGAPSKAVADLPFYHLVPKHPVKQMRWRIFIREQVNRSEEFKAAIDYCCSRDILFAFNTFFYVFETRPTGRRLPFNTWPDQDDYICWFYECINQQRDAIGEKCRGVGWSYLGTGLGYYDWRWPPLGTQSMIGMVSRKKEAVDSDDPDSLFWKLDFLHRNMPEAMRTDEDGKDILDRTVAKFVNLENGSSINGYEAGPNAMTGGRKRWILHDEAAKFPYNAQEVLDSTQHVTNCRLVISTFWRGTRTRFYQMARREKSGALRVIGDWKNNPERAAGLYTFEGGVLKKLDPRFRHEPDYDFIDKEVRKEVFGGRIRSPWYDAECNRLGVTARSIAEEIDRDPQNTGQKFFEEDVIDQMELTVRKPSKLGIVTFRRDTPKNSSVIISDRGNLELWLDTNEQIEPLDGGPYSAGIDLAAGGGNQFSAYSSLVMFDCKTGEQVLEFVSNKLRPDDFADHCYAIFWWLCKKKGQSHVVCNFECNSSLGVSFGTRMVALGWGNFHKEATPLRGNRRKVMQYGWFNKDRGESVLWELQRAVHTKECVIRSSRIKVECGEYERAEDFKLIHCSSPASLAGDGKAHGDSAIAAAIAWMGCSALSKQDVEPAILEKKIPRSSIAGMFFDEIRRGRDNDDLDMEFDLDENLSYKQMMAAIDQNPFQSWNADQ